MNNRQRDEEIDRAIDSLAVTDNDTDELTRLASKLRDLPDPAFRAQLGSELFSADQRPPFWRRLLGLQHSTLSAGGEVSEGDSPRRGPAAAGVRSVGRRGRASIAASVGAVAVVAVLVGANLPRVGDAAQALVGLSEDACDDEDAACVLAERAPEAIDRLALPVDWETLSGRPLELPTLAAGEECPLTPAAEPSIGFAQALGDGPIYPLLPGIVRTASQGNKATSNRSWVSDSTYSGPALIRGAALSGSGEVYFWDGEEGGVRELRLSDAGTPAVVETVNGKREWFADTYVSESGCYALQIDGTSFTNVVVFAASECGLKLCSLEQAKVSADAGAEGRYFRGELDPFLVIPSDDEEAICIAEAADGAALPDSDLYFSVEGEGSSGLECSGSGHIFSVSARTVVGSDPPTSALIIRRYYEGAQLEIALDVAPERLVVREIEGRPALVVLRNQELIPDCQVFVVERPAREREPGIALELSGAFTCTAAKTLAAEFLRGLPAAP